VFDFHPQNIVGGDFSRGQSYNWTLAWWHGTCYSSNSIMPTLRQSGTSSWQSRRLVTDFVANFSTCRDGLCRQLSWFVFMTRGSFGESRRNGIWAYRGDCMILFISLFFWTTTLKTLLEYWSMHHISNFCDVDAAPYKFKMYLLTYFIVWYVVGYPSGVSVHKDLQLEQRNNLLQHDHRKPHPRKQAALWNHLGICETILMPVSNVWNNLD